MNNVSLNVEQQAAFDQFLQFMLSDEEAMIIEGPGGTGKSFLLQEVLNRGFAAYETTAKLLDIPIKYTSVQLTATTNTAAKELENYTKYPVSTIQSTLGLTVVKNFSTGVSSLQPVKRNVDLPMNVVIVIDEASMVDNALLGYIFNRSFDCKFVFVGDERQLPPVGDSSPVVFNRGWRTASLRMPMRNAGEPALIELCNQARETVKTGEFLPIKVNGTSIKHLEGDAFLDAVDAVFASKNADAKAMAYTNQRVNQFNWYIRKLHIGEENLLPEEEDVDNVLIPRVGDILVVNEMFCPSPKVRLNIDTEVEIKSVSEVKNYTEFDFVEVELVGGLTARVPTNMIQFKMCLKGLASQKNWSAYYATKESFLQLRLRECSTVHKAQGSSQTTSIIDLGDIASCRVPNQAARLLYVALSRARKEIILTGTLPKKYGGLIYAG